MTALLVVLVLALMLGGAGFAYNVLWYVAGIVFLLWLLGFVFSGTGHRWYSW